MENFKKYDTIEITTLHRNGSITQRRGVVSHIVLDVYKSMTAIEHVGIVSSDFRTYKIGIEIIEKSNFVPVNGKRYVHMSLLFCRIVLVEKSYPIHKQLKNLKY